MNIETSYLPILGQNVVPAVIIRLGNLRSEKVKIEDQYYRNISGYSEEMTEIELYDSGRAWWKISETRIKEDEIDYFVLSFQKRTLGIYQIEKIFGRDIDNRKAFCGRKIETGLVYEQYFGSVGKQIQFPKNSANPIYYWPPR